MRAYDLHADIEIKAAHKLSGGAAGSSTIATLLTSGSYDLTATGTQSP
ncbi:MAG: hypothetical protein ACJAYG_001983 [Oceanicoccus sp.]|jgi:hypothetical protein